MWPDVRIPAAAPPPGGAIASASAVSSSPRAPPSSDCYAAVGGGGVLAAPDGVAGAIQHVPGVEGVDGQGGPPGEPITALRRRDIPIYPAGRRVLPHRARCHIVGSDSVRVRQVQRAAAEEDAWVSAGFTSFHCWLVLPLSGYWMTAALSAVEPPETSRTWPLLREVKVTGFSLRTVHERKADPGSGTGRIYFLVVTGPAKGCLEPENLSGAGLTDTRSRRSGSPGPPPCSPSPRRRPRTRRDGRWRRRSAG